MGFSMLLCYHGNKLSSNFISEQYSINSLILGTYCRKITNITCFFGYWAESTHPKQNTFGVKLVGFSVLLCYHGNKLSSHFISDQISINQPILGTNCRKMRNNTFFCYIGQKEHILNRINFV